MNVIYEILFSSIEEGLIIVDVHGEILIANPRSHKIFGYEDNELIGKKVEDLIPASLRAKHQHYRKDYHHDPKNRRMGSGLNLKANRRDGSEFYVEVSLNPFKSKDKMLVAALITDITKRVEQEEHINELNRDLENKVEVRTKEVIENQELYRAIARNFPNGTINVFDRDLNYVFVEGKELHEAGITSEKLIGTSYLERLSEEIRPKIKKALINVFKGQKENFELEYKGSYYNINAVPLKTTDKEIDRILLVERNITEQKIVQQRQQEALEKEKKLNEMKSRFVSAASHEFRTPLSTVLSSVSLIEKYIEKEQYDRTEKHTKRIRSSVKVLTDILNDFLSVDKLENNKMEMKSREFDYVKFADEVVEEIKTISKTGQILEYDIKTDNGMINSDPNILKNILYNLLSNAIKYSKEGQKIIFNSVIRDQELNITVRDFGVGIPEHEQKQIFTRFFRAENVFNIEGTGLGLHIVQKYLEMLDGDITFESKQDEGTEFKLKIPLN